MPALPPLSSATDQQTVISKAYSLLSQNVTYPNQEGRLVTLPQLLEPIILLLLEVGLLLHLCLVEAVDDGVFALGHEDALHLARVLEADLADLHAAVLLEVGPGCVDDCDIVLLVAFPRVCVR